MDKIEFMLRPLPPFRLDLTAWALRRHPANTVDKFDGRSYSRVLVLDGEPVKVDVVQHGPSTKPFLWVGALGGRLPQSANVTTRDAIVSLLGLDIDLTAFYSAASKHSRLGALARKFRGMKPPRFPSIFETLVNAIACQQVSLNVGLLLLSRLSQKCGLRIGYNGHEAESFPIPERVSRLDIQQLRTMGFSKQKASYLLGLSRAICDESLDLESVPALDDQEAMEHLMSVRGIGRWSAEYTLLRGCGRLSVFPGDDVGGQNGLRSWMGASGKLDYEKVRLLLERWKDFRGLIYFHLLLNRLEKSGYLELNE